MAALVEFEGLTPRIPGKPGEIGICSCASQDFGIPLGDRSATLTFECASHHGGATPSVAGFNDVIDKLDQIVREPDSNLLAHPKTVPLRDSAAARIDSMNEYELHSWGDFALAVDG